MKTKSILTKVFAIVMIVLLIGVPVVNVKAQAPASIVYDPSNGITLGSILTTIKDVKEVQEEWKANSEFLKKIANEATEVKRLIALSESLVCAMDEFEIYIGVVGDLTLCNRKLKMDITLSKIDGVSGKLKSLVGGAYVLSQIETINSLKDLNDEMEDAINELNGINTELKVDVVNTLRAGSGSELGHQEVSWGTDANI